MTRSKRRGAQPWLRGDSSGFPKQPAAGVRPESSSAYICLLWTKWSGASISKDGNVAKLSPDGVPLSASASFDGLSSLLPLAAFWADRRITPPYRTQTLSRLQGCPPPTDNEGPASTDAFLFSYSALVIIISLPSYY